MAPTGLEAKPTDRAPGAVALAPVAADTGTAATAASRKPAALSRESVWFI
jgi:hypothetical protein